jgi:hypothetical protein
MRMNGRADDVLVDTDECGWSLVILDEDGASFTFRLDQNVAQRLVDEVQPIRDWLAEGEAARREMHLREAGQLTVEDVIESGAADLMRDMHRGK